MRAFSEEDMEEFKVKQLKSLVNIDLTHLVKESKNEGFRFLERLVNDYKNGTNNFNKPGESLYGLFNKKGVLIAIGGLNIDPFSNDEKVGRLRRFFVSRDYRRNGLGRLLLTQIINDAKHFFKVLVLHTDTEQGDKFYTSFGFSKENIYPNSTHYLSLSSMRKVNKLTPFEAAHQFINEHFPNCQGALLAGSVVRGEATETSDLDIVIFDNNLNSSYRESLIAYGWAIEVFVHNLTTYKEFFEMDYERARPSMPRMVSEGIVLKDVGIIDSIKKEAMDILNQGPEEWSVETINTKRYFITDALDDFIGCSIRAEEIFIANTLADLLSEFILRTNRQWIGASKWVIRSLKSYDEEFANHFVEAFDIFYKTGNKNQVIQLVYSVLQPFGGQLFDGFSLGKS